MITEKEYKEAKNIVDNYKTQQLNIGDVSDNFEVGDEIIVCDDLITTITRVSGDEIFFFNEDNVEKWDNKDVIKHYCR